MTRAFAAKNLCELTKLEFAALRDLRVSEHQEVLGKSFSESIEDWETALQNQVLGLCFLLETQPVGLTLFKKRSTSTASIHGLKIATPWQRKGLGHLAFRLAVDQLKEAWPEIKSLVLAVDAENFPAIAIYRAYGMNDSGPVFQGPNGLEHHMEMQFKN